MSQSYSRWGDLGTNFSAMVPLTAPRCGATRETVKSRERLALPVRNPVGEPTSSPVDAALTYTCLSCGMYEYSFRPSDTNILGSGDLYSHRILPGFLTRSRPLSVSSFLRTPPRYL